MARKLGTILAARDWERLLECVLLLQFECAEQLAERVLLDPEAASAATAAPVPVTPASAAAAAATSPADADAQQQGEERAEEAKEEEAEQQAAAKDELLLQRLLWAWRRYASWLDHTSYP